MTGFGYNINGFGAVGAAAGEANGSIYFSGDAVLSTGFNLVVNTSQAFCFEAWVYITNLDSYNNIFSSWEGGSSYDGVLMHISSSGGHFFGWSGSVLQGSGATVALNTWTHVAVTRNAGSAIKFFTGGASAGTATSSANIGGSGETLFMGANMDGGGAGAYTMHGYISNARIVVGEQVYTGAFTPATTPLTLTSQGVTSSNVKLLCAQSPTDITAEQTGKTLSAVAAADDDPVASAENPFS